MNINHTVDIVLCRVNQNKVSNSSYDNVFIHVGGGEHRKLHFQTSNAEQFKAKKSA